MPSEVRVECPKCLLPLAGAKDYDTYAPGEGSHLCWGGAPCYARVCQMQAHVQEMVRLLERLVRHYFYLTIRQEMEIVADAKALLSRARGEET